MSDSYEYNNLLDQTKKAQGINSESLNRIKWKVKREPFAVRKKGSEHAKCVKQKENWWKKSLDCKFFILLSTKRTEIKVKRLSKAFYKKISSDWIDDFNAHSYACKGSYE